MFALLPRIVPRAELSKANAWMTSVMMFARISGPALGGILFGWLGIEVAASVVCLSLVLAVGALALIQVNPGPKPRVLGEAKLSLKEELLSGAKFVFSHPILLPALSVDMVSVLFGGVTALLPIYAAEILHIGAQGLGALRAAPALGAAITSISLTRLDIQRSAGRWLFSCIGGFGLCIVVFALSRDFLLSLMALGLSGAFDSVSMVIRSSAVQLVSPDDMRGRISAVNSIFIGSSNELGEFESGVLAKVIGTMNAALLGGVVCLLTVSVVAVLSPTLRKLDLEELAARG
jgi:hypothetical protein